MKLHKLLALMLALNVASIHANSDQKSQDKAEFDAVGLQAYMQAIVSVQQQCSQKNNTEECRKALVALNCVLLYYCDALKGARDAGALDKTFQGKRVQATDDAELKARMKALSVKASEKFIKYANSL